MPELNIDLSGAQKWEDIPEGWHAFEVALCEAKESSQGNKMLSMRFKDISGVAKGRMAFDNWMLETDAAGRTRTFMEKLGWIGKDGKGKIAIPEGVIGFQLEARIKHVDDVRNPGEKQARIVNVRLPTGDVEPG